MNTNPYCSSALHVSALGLGVGQISDVAQDEAAFAHLQNSALDRGVSLIDAERGYCLGETRIGRHLAHRRREFAVDQSGLWQSGP